MKTLVALLLCAASATAAPLYTLTPIGNPTANDFYSYARGAGGEVFGVEYTPATFTYGDVYRWTAGGGFVNLGPVEAGSAAIPLGGNASGQFAGYRYMGGTAPFTLPLIWTPGTGLHYPTVPSPLNYNELSVINNGGLAVGWTGDIGIGTPRQAAIWTAGGGFVPIGNPAGETTSSASAVNDAGVVAGSSASGDIFTWTAGGGFVNLGRPVDTTAYVRAMNDAGDIVGGLDTLSGPGAFLWTAGGGFLEIADFTPAAINDSRHIVGDTFDGFGNDAAFHTPGDGLISLDSLLVGAAGWDLFSAFMIAADGSIVARGSFLGGPETLVLLTPISPVPEPAALGAFVAAAAAACAARRRFRRPAA